MAPETGVHAPADLVADPLTGLRADAIQLPLDRRLGALERRNDREDGVADGGCHSVLLGGLCLLGADPRLPLGLSGLGGFVLTNGLQASIGRY